MIPVYSSLFLNFLNENMSLKPKCVESGTEMMIQEGPKFTSSHGHTKYIAIYGAILSKRNIETS